MFQGDHHISRAPGWEDPALDFDYGPEVKDWDEEDGLFDNEEIVVS